MRRTGALPCLVILGALFMASVPTSFVAGGDHEPELVQMFIRGDVTLDGEPGLTDALDSLYYLFSDREPNVDCDKAYDFNDSGGLGIGDPIYLLTYLFLEGDEPPMPFGGCGTDATADSLTCNEYSACDAVEPTDAATTAHVLRRITYGQTPALFDRVLEMGVQNYINEQLHPEDIDESDNDPLNDLLAEVSPRTIPIDLIRLQIIRGLYSERQLVEVLTDFWENHFNTDFRVTRRFFRDDDHGAEAATFFEARENDAFRDNALGNFGDLLLASATSPTMLIYLDNISNFAGNPNENYARELLELHTMGVDNGYSQEDIEAVARVFTGWRVCRVEAEDADDPEAECYRLDRDIPEDADGYVWAFHFDAAHHDDEEKTIFEDTAYEIVLGDDEEGIDEGLEFLEHLATMSQTAEYLSTKLVQKLVNDDPPLSLVADCLAVWQETAGDIKAVVETILTSEEFLDPENRLAKVKTPLEYILSTVRAYGGEVSARMRQIIGSLELMPHIPFFFETPDGFPESGEDQIGTQKLRNRIAFNEFIYRSGDVDRSDDDSPHVADIEFPNVVEIMDDHKVDLEDAESVVTFWLDRLFPEAYNDTDLDLAVEFLETDDEGEEAELDSTTDDYALRVLKLLAFISSYPQHLEQ